MKKWYRLPGRADIVRKRVKKYREDNLEMVREKDRVRGYRAYDIEKVRARQATTKLEKRPCEVCGTLPADAHHDDYRQPLEVRWLCRIHHGEAHRVVI